jgi:hypothetical protein
MNDGECTIHLASVRGGGLDLARLSFKRPARGGRRRRDGRTAEGNVLSHPARDKLIVARRSRPRQAPPLTCLTL